MKNFLTGTVTAMITPFQGNKLNLTAFGEMLEAQIAAGTSAAVVLGTTGEPATVSPHERDELIEYAVFKAQKRLKVLVGTGSNDQKKAVFQSRRAQRLGADGLLVVTPYYNKCTQDGLFEYYRAVASAADLPIVCYNVPSRTGVNLLPETMARIAAFENIAGIKEASGNLMQVMECLRLLKDVCDVYSGDDALNLPILALGGSAAVSVVSNLAPKKVAALYSAVQSNDLALANRLNSELFPLYKACFCEVNPIPVKEGMNLLGFEAGVPRPPLTRLSEKGRALLVSALRENGLL